MVTDSVETELR